MPQGDTVFFPMTDYWMGRLIDGRRVEVRASYNFIYWGYPTPTGFL